MLHNLFIENYALIEYLNIPINPGLTVITGETGAGKSIIMGALGLILGQRADAKIVRIGATKCVIEATFDVSNYKLQRFFEANDLEYDATNTIIRREVYATGKSRAFVNDTPVQLAVLKELGQALIDIHSQHQNLLLGNDSFQQHVVDTLAANQKELAAYQTLYKELVAKRKQLKQLKEEAAQSATELDYMQYQFNQLEDANLTEGEQEELESELAVLTHAEEIKNNLFEISNMLNGSQNGIVQTLKQAFHLADGLTSIYPEVTELAQRIETDFIDLKDIAEEVESKSDAVNFDPERSAFVEERLEQIYSLEKKYKRQTVEELLQLKAELEEKLQHIDNNDFEIEEMTKAIAAQTVQVRISAEALTATRTKAAREFEKKLVEKVSYLGMPNTKFEVSITPTEQFTPTGADNIQFLFSANKNQPLKPAGEVASGGEISRLMLSIKYLISTATTLPTIIFDEIDTGVSGDIADRMGQIMKEMSHHLQVITITHLPQVAGKGDSHYKVYKEDTKDATLSHIEILDEEKRINEIARMLSGAKLTPQAIENARVLLGKDE